jgi:hypothetical protein
MMHREITLCVCVFSVVRHRQSGKINTDEITPSSHCMPHSTLVTLRLKIWGDM